MSKKKKHPKLQEQDAEGGAGEQLAPQTEKPFSLQEERDDLLARLQRVSADYMNYQKRVQRDIAQVREFANEALIKDLLAVLDDMERALDAARANHDPEDPLLTGMQLVHDKALDTLGKFGLEKIAAEGEPFDPEKHAAMIHEASAEHPPQTVLRELQKGYTLKGRAIRPSSVIVSKIPEELETEEHLDEDEEPSEESGPNE